MEITTYGGSYPKTVFNFPYKIAGVTSDNDNYYYVARDEDLERMRIESGETYYIDIYSSRSVLLAKEIDDALTNYTIDDIYQVAIEEAKIKTCRSYFYQHFQHQQC